MIEFTIQEQDIVASIRMRRKRLRAGIAGIFLFWIPMAITLMSGVFGVWLIILGPYHELSTGTGYWFLGFFAYFIILIGLGYALTPVFARRIYNKIGFATIPVKLDWDYEKMVTEDRYAKSSVPWKDFDRWYENHQLFMLYYRKLVPRIIPKRILSETQIADIRRHLQEQVGPQGIMRK